MTATIHFPPLLIPLLFAGTAPLLSACGGETQTRAVVAPPPPAEPAGSTNTQAAMPLPNTPTASNVVISEEVLRACNIPDSNAYFQFDSSRLTDFDQAPLDALAVCFSKGPMAGRKLRLIGHADPRGAAGYNMTLGQSRADSVAGYLTERNVGRDNVSSTSRGAMDATGRDETGWAHDRRVDVMLGE